MMMMTRLVMLQQITNMSSTSMDRVLRKSWKEL